VFIADMEPARQRARILDATIVVVAQRGLAGASVANVITRARVSRRTFNAHFKDLDGALVAVIDDALAQVSEIVRDAFAAERSWRGRIRTSLAGVLHFFERRPELARVLLVETLTGSPTLVRHRRAAVDRFCALVVGRIDDDSLGCSALVTEGALACVMGVVYGRLIDRDRPPLVELIGPLMSVLSALASAEPETDVERRRDRELAHALDAAAKAVAQSAAVADDDEVPGFLRDPRSFRARQCLLYVVAHPGLSNRQIGDGVGVSHRGQLCALLNGLYRRGLLSKDSGRPGRPNSWCATSNGRRAALALE
jgi:AcrR family transcriptional regulator